MNSVLGTQFEASLRVLVLLEAAHEEMLTEGEIVAFDYIAAYAHDFGVAVTNLHGDSQYRFNELVARRELIKRGIKNLVLDGLVAVEKTNQGFLFSITPEGFSFVFNLDNTYANDYYDVVVNVMASFRGKSEDALFRIINQRIIKSVQRG